MLTEYIEGSKFNKAIEIYNGTGADVALADYQLELYNNGADTANTVFTLGTSEDILASGDAFVVVNSQADAALYDLGDAVSNVTSFNGDDALVLAGMSGDERRVVDSFGQVGVDPGARWGSEDVSTVDATLRRNGTTADTNPIDAFEPADQWDEFPNNTFDDLGTFVLGGDGSDPDPGPGVELCDVKRRSSPPVSCEGRR